ncbi:MAG: 2-hydroxyacid dehydrogenase [Bacteriovoracaceae bacterium]
MKIAFFDTHRFDKKAFNQANTHFNFEINYLETRLNEKTATLAENAFAVCVFVNDHINEKCISILAKLGVKIIALRSAGFNNVDLKAANNAGIIVVRVPSYSPHAIAEFATGMLLTLSRNIHRAYYRVRELNFSLDGLVGINLYQKKIGVIGTGKIGQIFAEIMTAFGCSVLVCDQVKNSTLEKNPKISYTDLNTLCKESDVISLHLPLTPQTHHIINQEQISQMKNGVIIINTGRGALIDSKALISGLKSEKIGGAALDVYEEEENVFFKDLSNKILQDDQLARLLSFPNVLITSHQAFLTKESLEVIAMTTLNNIDQFKKTENVDKDKVVNSIIS